MLHSCQIVNMTFVLMNSLQSGTTITDQMDLFREQVKMLAGEVALSTSSLKRLSEQAAINPEDSHIKVSYSLVYCLNMILCW